MSRRIAKVIELLRVVVWIAVLCAFVVLHANGQVAVSLIGAGSNPTAVAVNPVTNQVFVVNYASNNMTIFDPITGKSVTVAVGSRPSAVVVNPVTNMAYVANEYNVIAVDGKNPTATQTITTGGATCLAVNPTTNMIFACVNKGVAAINGATNSFAIYSTGKTDGYRARLIAVNTKLNRIYVANSDWTFNTIDIDTSTNTQQDVNWIATAIGVNPQTDKVYVAANNMSVGHLVVMDAAGSILNDYPAGTIATAVAINPATNKVYVTNHYTNDTTYKDDVLVLDGDSGVLTTLANGGNGGRAVAVNPVTNQVYVLHDLDKTVSVIDGNSNAISAVNIGRNLWEVAVNPTTGQVFATNPDDSSFAMIGESMPAKITVKETNLISPWSIAANPVTNKVYVANSGSNNTPGPVTIIDGDTNAVKSVTAGIGEWVAVDPAINKVYIGHGSTTTLVIFDGATEQYSTVYYTDLAKMAVNPNDNTLYLVNYSATASVLDPATKQFTNINIGGRGQFLAVNPATNKIYITNGANLVVIDGATKQVVKTITDAARPGAISINPKTNRIYITNTYDSTVSVIDGSTDTVVSHVTMGLYPAESVVNPETNRAYFVEAYNIKVLDGATNTISASIPMQCSSGCSIYINPAINKIYVTQYPSGIAIIDGATNQSAFVATGDGAHMMGINPVNNKLYVANRFDDSITVIGPSTTAQNPLTTTVQPLPGDVTSNPGPVIKFTATNGFTPHAADVQNVYYQVDSWLGRWVKTQYADGEFAAQLDTLWPGTHTVYAFATDGSDATALAKAANLVGGISTYSFSVTGSAPPPAVPVLDVAPTAMTFDAVQGGSNPVAEVVTISNTGGGTVSWTASKTQTWLSLDAASGTGDGTLGVSVDVSGLTAGTYTDTITIAAAGATGSPKTVAVTFTVQAPPAALGVDVTTLTFSAVVGTSNPAAQTMTITNTGGGTMNWTASKTKGWLSLNTASGTAPASVQVSANISGLAVGTYQDTITVTAAGATGSPKTVAVTVNVLAAPDFQLSMGSGSTPSAMVTAGGTATFTIMAAPMNSFSGMVTMSCSGLPSKAACAFSPAQQQVTGSTAMPFTMTITTTRQTTTAGFIAPISSWPSTMAMAWASAIGAFSLLAARRRRRLVLAMITIVAVVGLGSCGGGSSSQVVPGTPAGTYPITVTATSGTTTHSTTVTLTVN